MPGGGFNSSPLNNSGSLPPLSRIPADRKNSGAKLLDITEQPLGYVQAKKRKQMQVAVVAPLRQTSEATASHAADTTATTVPSYVPRVTMQSPVILPVSQPKHVIKIRPLPPVTQNRLQPVDTAGTNNSQRNGLTLTRAQMLEAQDILSTANRATRPEKALILGFMAGARDNPCSDLGNVVTIKLGENQENVLQADDTYLNMLVETHFQMNYNTGEWKRIKKYRKLDDSNAPLPSITSLATAATAT